MIQVFALRRLSRGRQIQNFQPECFNCIRAFALSKALV